MTYLPEVIELDPDRFEALVVDALDSLPAELADRLDNVVVRVRPGRSTGALLGLYEGVPATEREAYGNGPVGPDVVTLYRLPICSICDTESEVAEQVRVTVIHEIAHHFGIDDDRLEELGWA